LKCHRLCKVELKGEGDQPSKRADLIFDMSEEEKKLPFFRRHRSELCLRHRHAVYENDGMHGGFLGQALLLDVAMAYHNRGTILAHTGRRG
jgi:hypothetical protein